MESYCSLRRKHGQVRRMFVHNRSRTGHGLAALGPSLPAVRGPVILNSLPDRQVFAIHEEQVGTALGLAPVCANLPDRSRYIASLREG